MECMCAQTRPRFILSSVRVGLASISAFTVDLSLDLVLHLATMPGAWGYGVSAGTGWLGVSIL